MLLQQVFFMKGRLLKIDIASTIKKEVDPKEMEFLKKIKNYKE